MSTDVIKNKVIRFENDHEATALFPTAGDKVEDIVTGLAIKPYKAIILVLGGADNIDDAVMPLLDQLFGRGIARAAGDANAVIIDGGTQTGSIGLMGKGVAARGYLSQLIGVAPAGLVTYPGNATTGTPLESNHSHFVLVEGKTWGSEIPVTLSLLKALAATTTGSTDDKARNIPALAILAGGGTNTRNEVLLSVRQNFPLIVIEGSGGLADEIAAAWKNRNTLPDDPVMAEIIADGEIHLHSLKDSVKGIGRLILRQFLGIDNVLLQAWETFADYDLNANQQQSKFDKLQKGIIFLGVAGTALVVFQQVYGPKDASHNLVKVGALTGKQFVWIFFHYLLILIPIVLTILITAANRFKQGTKWLLLRAGAESIKREIYRYRARAMYYKENAEQQLALSIEDITRRTMRTEVNSTALTPYDKEKLGFPPYMFGAGRIDDGFSYLTPDRYVEVRLADQLSYFRRKSVILEKKLKLLYWLTFVVGGIGTFLAAIDQQVWIAVTTAIVAGFGTYLGYRQTESTLTKYNQAATDLANVKAWWNALSAEQQSLQTNIDSLVEHTEQVLQSELDGWIQQMQNALAELREKESTKKQEEKTAEREENKEPGTKDKADPKAEKPIASPEEKQEESVQKEGESIEETEVPAEIKENGDAAESDTQEAKPGEDEIVPPEAETPKEGE